MVILFVHSGVFFDSCLLFSSSSVCRLLSKGETCLQTAPLGSWFVSYFLCMEGMGESLGVKKINNKTNKERKGTFQTWLSLQDGLRLNLCRLFSLYSTAGEKLPYIWHQLALGRDSLWWICICCFKEIHHKGIVHAFYTVWEKSTFQKISTAYLDINILPEWPSVRCVVFRYSCLLRKPVSPPHSRAAAQLRQN